MLLENKNAVIYGAGGSIGSAVARAFAREGARVFLAGRTLESLEEVAEQIRSAGGVAESAQVDALDEQAVDRYVDAVAERAGSIDISFNLISYGDVQGTPLAEMAPEDFERPVMNAVRTQFLTSKAAARHMIRQGSGVILMFGGAGGRDPIRDYASGGFPGLPRRFPGCLGRDRRPAPPAGRGARAARHSRRDPPERRRAGDNPRGLARGHNPKLY
jgi:3-oxoacyl-[acyl-carrier protein] reductase